jgi:hypothetical protein
MTIYALAESRAVMKFYEALASGKIARIYEAYQYYKDTLDAARKESFKQERKIDDEYRKAVR